MVDNKKDYCTTEECRNGKLSEVIDCRLKSLEQYRISRYQPQLKCLKNKFISFHGGSPNEVFCYIK